MGDKVILLINKHYPRKWAIVWRQSNKLAEDSRSFVIEPTRGMTILFSTRKEARAYRESRWGHIREKDGLQWKAQGWKFPQVVKVIVYIEESV